MPAGFSSAGIGPTSGACRLAQSVHVRLPPRQADALPVILQRHALVIGSNADASIVRSTRSR
jgi:hypothetical protein